MARAALSVLWRASSGLAATAFLGLACESIAGVEDVSVATTARPGCDEYCETVSENCAGTLAVYEDFEACMAACGALDPGGSREATGNTVSCRLQQAKNAGKTPSTIEKKFHCASAGPGGGSLCTDHADVPDCEGYCTVYASACGEDPDALGFGTFDECIDDCRAVPSAVEGKYVDVDNFGDTLACRLYYATRAARDGGKANCTNAGLRPAGPCLGKGEPSCEDYCRAVDAACRGELAVYEKGQCESVCAALPPGKRSDSEGNTIGCRVSHAYNAILVDTVHCNHVGPIGDAGCKDGDDSNCSSYCRLASTACPEQFESEFGSESVCLSKCSALEDAGNVKYHVATAPNGGNSLKCRTFHTARALALDVDERDAAVCAPIFGEAPCR